MMLLAAGILLLLAEVFIFPGFGVAGVLGTLAIMASIFMSLIGSLPTTTDLMVASGVVGLSILMVMFTGYQLIRRLPEDRRAQRILLRTSTSREAGYQASPQRDELVGAEGTALTDLRPAGTAVFGEEKVDVVSDGPWVPAGTRVRVIQSDGYRLVIRSVAPSA
jgi:membrane-bound serine protease (ClpP class)